MKSLLPRFPAKNHIQGVPTGLFEKKFSFPTAWLGKKWYQSFLSEYRLEFFPEELGKEETQNYDILWGADEIYNYRPF